jgi:hypothetical protein
MDLGHQVSLYPAGWLKLLLDQVGQSVLPEG